MMGPMLNSAAAWEIVLEHAPKGVWLSVRDLYDVVAANVVLDDRDREPVASGTSARWNRTVRNALQRHKSAGDVEWERGKGFRFG